MGFEIPSHAVDALEQHMLLHAQAAHDATVLAHRSVLDDVREAAAAHPSWGPELAAQIDTWDENDRTWIGTRGAGFESQAFAAEYGDDKRAPSGHMRTLDNTMNLAAQRAQQHLASRGAF